MNVVDVIIAIFALALAIMGYERGLIASALPLAGFVAGAVAGGRLGPALLAGGGESQYAPLITVVAGLIAGTLFAVIMQGIAEGLRLRYVPARGMLAGLDGVGGAALNTPGPGERDLRDALQQSRILRTLNDVLPPSGPILNLLRHIDPVPAVNGPQARVGAPNAAIANDPDVRRAGDSVVKVLGTACGLGIEGSGCVAGPEVVVTNAHVVAGESDTSVTSRSGDSLDATAVHFDPRNDLAILRVQGLSLAALPIASDVAAGAPGAVLGYPENGPFSVSPVRIGTTGRVISQDSYGRGPIAREMTPFRGEVRSGNSGGPAVDGGGQVVTTVFAAQKGKGPPGGLGVPDDVVQDALQGDLSPTGTGPCTA